MLSYTIVGDEDGSNIVVFVDGNAPAVAHSTHPNYDAIVAGAKDGDEGCLSLFDIAATVATYFERLSERVTTAYGRLYFDGVEVANALTAQVLRFLDAGVSDWRPLVAFFEKVQGNPSDHSREQLYAWLDGRDFAIADNGDLIGYKGVAKDADGNLVSVHSGRAIVNGTAHVGQIPNPLGALVEMPRDEVTADPALGCHAGLHVGTFDYAQGYASGAMLEVHVNPRDVVSVPTDCSAAKLRTCRYRVVKHIDAPHTSPVVYGDDYDRDGDDFADGESDAWRY